MNRETRPHLNNDALPLNKKHGLSAEAVRLINELWECLELLWKRTPTPKEIQDQITNKDGEVMSEYKLRQLVLKFKSAYRSMGRDNKS
ncbi:MAG: hypothetical protein QXU32_02125 [Nitrososphaerales archaeon]